MKKRAEELAAAHWGYLEDLLLSHDVDIDEVNIIGFHYQTAFVHGHGHGVEDLMKEELNGKSIN